MRPTEPHDILMQLDELGVHVEANGDTLLFRPASAVPQELRDRMAGNKHAILAILRREHCPPPSRFAREFASLLASIPDPDRRAELRGRFESRAGVLTYARGLPWDEADRLALESLREEAGRRIVN